jgi:hypothetical protein
VDWAAAYILFGLRHSPALAEQLLRGVLDYSSGGMDRSADAPYPEFW